MKGYRILFVCLGNICRSPTAEAVLREQARRLSPGLVEEVDSAGTGNYHIGEPPDRRTQAAARKRGYDLSALRARQVTAGDFTRFDLVLAMDARNLSDLRKLAPKGLAHRARMFLGDSSGGEPREVPDPYLGVATDFDEVVDIVEQGVGELLAQLATIQSSRPGPED